MVPISRLLHDKVAIIVGASRGIGAATAKIFAAAGARVVVAARNHIDLQNLVQTILDTGGEAVAIPTDVRDAAQVAALVDATMARFGRLDIAFNNAGAGNRPAPLVELSVEELDASLALNLRGVLVAMKYEIAAMVESGGGAMVNMSSTAGLQGVRGLYAYASAKHAIVGASKSAALDYASKNIRVNVVAPGPILTERIAALPEEHRAPIARAVPMGRIGLPVEVGMAVAWLCSEQAAFITGAVLPVDGGRLAGAP